MGKFVKIMPSTLFSAAEAHYVPDGLTHNDVVIPNAHSTDTHGFSEPVFAIYPIKEGDIKKNP